MTRLYPDPANRFCCPACREPIPDVDTISPEEAERRHLAYVESRRAWRVVNPHLTRRQIEDASR
jgi:hypothetical protein